MIEAIYVIGSMWWSGRVYLILATRSTQRRPGNVSELAKGFGQKCASANVCEQDESNIIEFRSG